MAAFADEFDAVERRTLEKLPVSLAVFRAKGGRLTLILVSDGFCRLLGDARERILAGWNEDRTSYIHPEDVQRVLDANNAVLTSADNRYTAVYRLKTAGGGCVHASGMAWTVRRHGVVWVYVNYTDVTSEYEYGEAREEDLNRTNSLLQNILSTTQTALFWKDADRRFLGANRAFLDYYGFSSEQEILGKNDEDMGWHRAPGQFRDDELRVLAGESTYRVQGKCIARGEERDIVASKAPMYVNGSIAGLVGSFEDVTREHSQREEISRLNAELKRRIAEHELLTNAVRVCTFRLLLDRDFTVCDCNDAVYASCGYAKEELAELCGHSLRRYYEAAGMAGEFARIADELGKIVAGGVNYAELALRMPTKSGFAWISASGALTGERHGVTRVMYIVYRDISSFVEMQEKLHRAEEQAAAAALLEKQNARMQQLIDNVPIGLCVFRREGGVTKRIAANRYFCDMFNVSGRTLLCDVGSDFWRGVHPDDFAAARKAYGELFGENRYANVEYRLKDAASGKYIWLHAEGRTVEETNGALTSYVRYGNVTPRKEAERAILEGRMLYETAAEAAKLVVWEYDIPNRRVVMTDNEFSTRDYTKFGLQKVTEEVPDSLLEYIDEKDQEKFLAMYREVASGRSASCEVWYRSRQGQEPRCERITYTAVTDQDGRPLKAFGIGQNITAQKRAEERYLEETEAIRTMNRSDLIAKGHHDLTQNRIIEYAAQNGNSVTPAPGCTYEDVCRAVLDITCSDKDRLALSEMLDRHNLIARFHEGVTRFRLEYQRRMPERPKVWALTVVNTFCAPQSGDVECFIYTFDMTAAVLEKQIITRMTELGYDYIGLINTADATFTYYTISDSEEDSEGSARPVDYDAHLRRRIDEHVPQSLNGSVYEATRLSTLVSELDKNGSYRFVYDRYGTDGFLQRKLLQYRYLDDSRDTIFVCKSDITQQYRSEQEQLRRTHSALLAAEKANEAKSTFLSSVSHDMRTPLNGIIGFTDLALRSQVPAKKQDYLEKIRLSSSLLLSLINDTLELSRIESGKFVLEPQTVCARELFDTLVTAVQPTADAKGVTFSPSFRNEASEYVTADKLKLQEILLNLLSNAVKFTLPGGTVGFSAELLARHDGGVLFQAVVKDDGIGIGADFLPKLFEPFAQERRQEARNVAGTGLGLSIVKRLVTFMGGSISVDSSVGRGTKFTVSLPLVTAAGSAEQPQEAACACSLAGKTVLLCEDNQLNAEIAKTLLEERGMTVVCAENGREGFDVFADSEEGGFCAVLMDIRMPVMDGYAATARIRALPRADAATVPIIAMTADAFEDDVKKCLAAGMNGHVAKPIEPERLFGELARLCGENGRDR